MGAVVNVVTARAPKVGVGEGTSVGRVDGSGVDGARVGPGVKDVG